MFSGAKKMPKSFLKHCSFCTKKLHKMKFKKVCLFFLEIKKKYISIQKFYRLRNIFNCVLLHQRQLTAGLLYNDFVPKTGYVAGDITTEHFSSPIFQMCQETSIQMDPTPTIIFGQPNIPGIHSCPEIYMNNFIALPTSTSSLL